MSIKENLQNIKSSLPSGVTLIAVTKTHPVEKLIELYQAGHVIFGENKVQEMCDKYEQLPKDIQWHQIGHLQTNKVKFIAPFVSLIHSADSLKLLQEINKQALKSQRVIDCLLQIYIAMEETKFGLSFEEAAELMDSEQLQKLKNIRITGVMGVASNTIDKDIIRLEFKLLKSFFYKIKVRTNNNYFTILSMGMSSDYKIAVEEGSNMVRIGSLIFGDRKYHN